MSYPNDGTLAVHVEAAKRLLDRLEEQAAIALAALKRDGGAGLLDALDERSHLLSQLTEVAEAIAQKGAIEVAADETLPPMLTEMARAAAAALESQQLLTAHAASERKRLVAVLQNTNRPDAVAQRYAVATGGSLQRATLSVSG